MVDPIKRKLIQLHHTCYLCHACLSRAQRLNSHLASVHNVHVPSRPKGMKRGYSTQFLRTNSLVIPRDEVLNAEVCIHHACGSCFQHFETINELARHTTTTHLGRNQPLLGHFCVPSTSSTSHGEIQHNKRNDQSKFDTVYYNDNDDTSSGYYGDNDQYSVTGPLVSENSIIDYADTIPVTKNDRDVLDQSEPSSASPPLHCMNNNNISTVLDEVIVQMRRLLSQL